MILAVDIGNTYIKFKAWDAGRFVVSGRTTHEDIELVTNRLAGRIPDSVMIANVGSVASESLVTGMFPSSICRKVCSQAKFRDVVNGYEVPAMLGVDRWLAVIEAYYHSGKNDCAVFDLGTALTLDVVDSSGRHRGGYIVPGLAMMRDALLNSTERVRYEPGNEFKLCYGKNTKDAVQNGTLSMVLGWVEREATLFRREYPGGAIYFTGGLSAAVAGYFDRSVIHYEDLVLDALLRIGAA